jgi:effector-binding domain-containing protein
MSVVRLVGVFVLLTAVAANTTAQQAPSQKVPAQPPAQPAPAPQPAKPAFETQVITTEAVHAVVLPMKGSYAQHPEAFGRLGAFLSGHGVTPSGPLFGRYFSDPSVGEANLVWEVGFPVPAGVTAEAPFEIKDLPATLCAVHVHRGPMEDLATAWPALIQWIVSNGYRPLGPATQVFKGDLAVTPEVELRMPVQK